MKKQLTVLIIDNDKMSAPTLRDILINNGMKVFLAKDERHVLGTMSGELIDVILFQPVLPESFLQTPQEIKKALYGEVGLIVLRNMRKIFKELPKIIFYTGISQPNLLEAGFTESEISSYVKQPELSGILIAEIKKDIVLVQ